MQSFVKIGQELWEPISQNPLVQVQVGVQAHFDLRNSNFARTLPMPYLVIMQSFVKIGQELWEPISQNRRVQVQVEVQVDFDLRGSNFVRTLPMPY